MDFIRKSVILSFLVPIFLSGTVYAVIASPLVQKYHRYKGSGGDNRHLRRVSVEYQEGEYGYKYRDGLYGYSKRTREDVVRGRREQPGRYEEITIKKRRRENSNQNNNNRRRRLFATQTEAKAKKSQKSQRYKGPGGDNQHMRRVSIEDGEYPRPKKDVRRRYYSAQQPRENNNQNNNRRRKSTTSQTEVKVRRSRKHHGYKRPGGDNRPMQPGSIKDGAREDERRRYFSAQQRRPEQQRRENNNQNNNRRRKSFKSRLSDLLDFLS